MPEIRYYTVSQEREVKVWANSPIDAAQIADGEFSGYKPSQVEGGVTSPIRVRDLVVREDYR
jgi:hypothetical protein